MNNRVNYTLVGALVVVGIALMLAFTYWLLKPSGEQEVKIYKIYFNESVLGLNIDAPVKYRGISVGKVTKLKINEKNSEQVEVQVKILKSTPIKTDTEAKLTAQGITGLSYINLSNGSNGAEDLVAQDGEDYPVIKTIPSFFENLETSFGSVSTELATTLTRARKLLNDENQQQVALVLKRTANLMGKMEKLLDDKTISHLQSTAKNLDNFSSKANRVTDNLDTLLTHSVKWENKISGSFNSIENSYKVISGAMDEIKRAVDSGEFNLKEIAGDVGPTMNNTMLEMQELMIRIDSMLEQYERSPRDILFKEEEIKKGPGE